MITMTITVRLRHGKQKEFAQAVDSLNGDWEKQQGLRKPELKQDVDDESRFSLIYLWERQEDLERYLRGSEYEVLRGALRVLGEKSEISYREISEKAPDLARSTENSVH